MPLIQWSEKYSVDVMRFNGHHKRLADLLNEIYDAMRTGTGPEAVGKTLGGLIDYTRWRFAEEERLMLEQGFEGYAQHKNEHDDLVKKVLEFQDKHGKGLAVTVEVFDFLKAWLTHHIMHTDKKYGAFFNRKGIV